MDHETGEQSQPAYPATKSDVSAAPVTSSSRVHSSAPRPCPNCGAPMRAGSSICTECGERVQFKPKDIRCRRCSGSASSALTVCPHCGRDLRPAPSRLWTWGAPVLVVTLFLIVIVGRWDGSSPLIWAQETVSHGLSLVNELSDQIEPGVTIVMTPMTGASLAEQVIEQSAEPGADQAAAPTPAAMVEEKATEIAAAGKDANAAQELDKSDETATMEPTPEPTTAPTTAPTDAPTPVALFVLPTATPTKQTAPKPTPSATIEPTPSATGAASSYIVRAADTLVGIADRFDVSTEALMAANNISARDVYALRVGQSLVIPPAGATVAAAAPTATSTATAVPTQTAAPTSKPAPAQSGFRLDAPVLRSPENGAPLSCTGNDALAWNPVAYMLVEDQYVVHLGYLSGVAAGGSEQVMWIIQQPRKVTETLWTPMGDDLCGLAPQHLGREWRWYVEVVGTKDGQRVPVSPPSEIWRFSWN